MTARSTLTTRTAMGLTVLLLDPPHLVGDIRLFAHGRLHAWPKWATLAEPDRTLVARFLRHRTEELAEDRSLLKRVTDELKANTDFTRSDEAKSWDTAFGEAGGRDVRERILSWLDELDRKLPSKGRRNVSSAGPSAELVAGKKHFQIHSSHIPAPSPALTLTTTTSVPTIDLDTAALRALARRIDKSGLRGASYEEIAVDGFLENLRTRAGHRTTSATAGPTQLIVAPTGVGKSVFARLLALQVAARVPVAIVVHDVRTVWQEAHRISQAASAAGLKRSVTALSSARRIGQRLDDHLKKPPGHDPNGHWALETFAYSCHLAAHSGDDEAPPLDHEPCNELRQRTVKKGFVDEERVACPFARQCGRFRAFESAVVADVLVVNHHSLLAGRVPLPISVDGGEPRDISTAELILRRCGLILIDEIDTLQAHAIGENTSSLVLSNRRTVGKAVALMGEVEEHRVERELEMSFQRGRLAASRIYNDAERIAEAVNSRDLEWTDRGRMTWRDAHDGYIARRLFKDAPDGVDAVRALFDEEPITSLPAETLRHALKPLIGKGLGDEALISETAENVIDALRAFIPETSDYAQTERALIRDRLIVRGLLLQIDTAIRDLRPQLAALESAGIKTASEIRNALLGNAPWQPSPTGPLGQRLNGYTFTGHADDPKSGALETRILGGDPHGLIGELGATVAETLAGSQRVVIGLSATCRFRGSPRSDVIAEVIGAVTDEKRNVTIADARVSERISGVSVRTKRLDAAALGARELWTSTLSSYLTEQTRDPVLKDRARALVVTGSYDEALVVGRALRDIAAQDAQVRFLVNDIAHVTREPGSITKADLESVGNVPAPAILVGPLSVVARGYNILQPSTNLSALSSIFVLTRPLPPSHDVDRMLAHISYNARRSVVPWEGTATATIAAERKTAWARLHAIKQSDPTLQKMNPALRLELVCDVLVDLAQAAGRARRGGTAVEMFFVDAAFGDRVRPWRDLVAEVLTSWRDSGELAEMVRLHGGFIQALASYSNFSLMEKR